MAHPDHPAPWPSRFWAYLQERFPLVNSLLFVILFLTGYTFTAFLVRPGAPVTADYRWPLAMLALYFFFLRLRVFDEHKDYEEDLRHYPDRVLQSGRISLRDLRRVAWAGTLFEAAVSWLFSPWAFACWLLAVGYSLLMAREFFVGEWLRPRLLLYALSHMLVMPLIVLWVGSMALEGAPMPWWGLVELGALSFCSGLAFEIVRKIRPPAAERPGILTYSAIFGYRRAPWVVALALLAAVLLNYDLLRQLGQGPGWYLALAVLWLGYLALGLAFVRRPAEASAKRLELGTSLVMLGIYVVVIAATLQRTGFHV